MAEDSNNADLLAQIAEIRERVERLEAENLRREQLLDRTVEGRDSRP